MNLKEKYSGSVSQYAEKDKGYNLLTDDIRHKDIMTDKVWQKSKYNFNPTVRKNLSLRSKRDGFEPSELCKFCSRHFPTTLNPMKNKYMNMLFPVDCLF